jgi:hypothetical protein
VTFSCWECCTVHFKKVQNVPLNVEPATTDAGMAASELPGNELVTTQNTAVACWQVGSESRGTPGTNSLTLRVDSH